MLIQHDNLSKVRVANVATSLALPLAELVLLFKELA